MNDEILDLMVSAFLTALVTTSFIILAIVILVGIVYYIIKCLIGYVKEKFDV